MFVESVVIHTQKIKETIMKKLLAFLIAFSLAGSVFAEAEVKEVCKDKKDKAGKVVNDKAGKPVQVCKKIKVHKKFEGTAVPEPTKKK